MKWKTTKKIGRCNKRRFEDGGNREVEEKTGRNGEK